jgi:type IV pilus assembly protein PilB
MVSQPSGLILATGPTGSGKTTTLYSCLKSIDSLRKNILTVEDPIEYNLPFVKQTQINEKAGYTFDVAIQAFLRQDPDVMLVGEIRDTDTAKLALRASNTGHLVLSTLHTNDAVGAIARLHDLGIQNYLLSSSLLAIISQRLVRKLCPHCKIKVENQDELINKYKIPDDIIKSAKKVTNYKANHQGCTKCTNIGYSSRDVIFEILKIDRTIENMILNSVSSLEILEYATSNGMQTIREDAFIKVLNGTIDFEEIDRVLLEKI